MNLAAEIAKARAVAAAIEALSTDTLQGLSRELLKILESVSIAAAAPSIPAPAPASSGRRLSMTPVAVKARAARAAKKAGVEAVEARQLPMFDGDRVPIVAPNDRPASAYLDAERSIAIDRDRSLPTTTTTDHISISDQQKKTARSIAIDHDPDDPPAWAWDVQRTIRPDLSEHQVRESWWFFATRTPSHADERRAIAHFGRWLRRERVRAPASKSAPAIVPEPESRVEPPARLEDAPPSSKRPRLVRHDERATETVPFAVAGKLAADLASMLDAPEPPTVSTVLERIERARSPPTAANA